MTTEQFNTITKALTAVFGECSSVTNNDDLEVCFTARGASAVIGQEPVEVESMNGPMVVSGFRVGIYNEDGEFEEEVSTPDLWKAIIVAQGLIAADIFMQTRWVGFDDEARQYE